MIQNEFSVKLTRDSFITIMSTLDDAINDSEATLKEYEAHPNIKEHENYYPNLIFDIAEKIGYLKSARKELKESIL